jgi:hypothetical protein
MTTRRTFSEATRLAVMRAAGAPIRIAANNAGAEISRGRNMGRGRPGTSQF